MYSMVPAFHIFLRSPTLNLFRTVRIHGRRNLEIRTAVLVGTIGCVLDMGNERNKRACGESILSALHFCLKELFTRIWRWNAYEVFNTARTLREWIN